MPYTKSTQKKYGDNPMKKKTGFKMKGFSGFIPPREKEKDVSIDKGGPVSASRTGMTYVHKYDDDGKLLPGYPKWVKKTKK